MRWMSLLVFATTLSSCKARSVCDERALDDAIIRFELDPGADDASLELINATSRACPDFPGTLFDALGHTYVPDDHYERRGSSLQPDPMHQWARRMACADPDRWSEVVSALPSDQRAQATYTICEFERLGLLEADEQFVFEDFPAVVTQVWMVNHDVDPALARRFNRGLMVATASEPLSRGRCHAHPDEFACQKLMRSHGGELPASSATFSIQLGLDRSTLLFVTPTWRAVGDQHEIADVSTLDDMHARLEEESRDAAEHELLLFADRQTSWADVIELMRLAHEHDYGAFSLVTAGYDLNNRLLLSLPATWSTNEHVVERAARYPVLVIEADAVRLPNGDTISLTDLARLADVARGLLGNAQDMSIVVRARADVQLQTMVSVLEAVRGRECSLDVNLEPNKGCVAWLPEVDLDPPMQRRPGDWSQLRLSMPEKPKAWPQRKGPATLKQLHARIEQALEPMRACLIASEDARTYMPDRMILLFGLDDRQQLGLYLWGPYSGQMPSDCIAKALDMPMGSPGRASATTFADAVVLIEVPD
jgi:biopolymer transport protein ExbD